MYFIQMAVNTDVFRRISDRCLLSWCARPLASGAAGECVADSSGLYNERAGPANQGAMDRARVRTQCTTFPPWTVPPRTHTSSGQFPSPLRTFSPSCAKTFSLSNAS